MANNMTLEVPIHTTHRSDCGHVRITYRPDWDKAQPWTTYRDGTAGRHFATRAAAVQFFAAAGTYFKGL